MLMNFPRKPILRGERQGGRPKLFESQKKTRVSVTMSKSILDRDYAAALATTGKKWFWGPLCQGKTSQSFCS